MDSIKFLTYNVWSCEHVAVYRRIRAICEIIERHDPDVIFLQVRPVSIDYVSIRNLSLCPHLY
jgi:hypothetical protein